MSELGEIRSELSGIRRELTEVNQQLLQLVDIQFAMLTEKGVATDD
jgi:hypothetical protein